MKGKWSFSVALVGWMVAANVATPQGAHRNKAGFAGEPLRCGVNQTGNATRWNYFDRGWRHFPIVDFHVDLGAEVEPKGVPAEVQLAIAGQAPYCATYISPGVEPPAEITEWPRAATSATFWRDSDLLPLIENRRIPKIDDPVNREKLAAIMRAELDTRPSYCPHVFVDNCGHVSSGWMRAPDGKTALVSWDALMRLLNGIREPGRLVVANLAVHPLSLSEPEVALLIASVDGAALEIGVHPNVREQTARMRQLIGFYQRMLAAGKIVVLMAVNKPLQDAFKAGTATLADLDAEARYTAAIGFMLREPDQKLWVAWPYTREAPDWQTWPEEMGAPVGSLVVLHDGSVAREYAAAWMIARSPRTVEITKKNN